MDPSWEANNWSFTQEIPGILCTFQVHKSPPLMPIPSQRNPVHTLQSYFFNVHLNIILTYTFRFLIISFLQVLLQKLYMQRSSLPFLLHFLPNLMLCDLTILISGEVYKLRSSSHNYKLFRNSAFPSFLSFLYVSFHPMPTVDNFTQSFLCTLRLRHVCSSVNK
jgi:hypothetical protein